MSTSQPQLSVQLCNVTKRFGHVVAVDKINLAIHKGEFFSFLGPSGCGKTTTLRMIAGQERPDEGDIFINQERVNDLPPYERNVSTVFQKLALFPHMTVGENIAFGLKLQRQPRNLIAAKVKEMLDLVRLPGMADRYPDQLSGGQQQRVALARSLVLEPEVLLLDEPLAALDRKLRKEMQIELRRIQQEVGITFIYVTHDQKEALSMSDHISVMNQSKIVQLGTPEEIYERPQTAFVADFLGASNFLPGRLIEERNELCLQTESGLIIFIESQKISKAKLNEERLLTLRPESIEVSVSRRPESVKNCFVARILDRVYLGESTELEVGLSDKERLKVHVDGHRDAAKLPIGAEIFVHWEPGVGSLVERE